MPDIYGTQDQKHPYDELVAKSGLADWKYTIFHPIVPIDARPCKRPGSATVQFVKHDGVVVSATRFIEGHVSFEGC